MIITDNKLNIFIYKSFTSEISEEKLHSFVLAFEVNRDFSQYYTCHTRKAKMQI